MKKTPAFFLFLLSFSLLLLTLSLSAQPPQGLNGPPPAIGRIYGKVLDAAKNTPLEYSSVTIQNLKDSSKIYGGLVDEKGNFEISNIRLGAYRLTVSFVGYTDYVIEKLSIIPPDKVETNLGTLKVQEDTKVLQEVEITGEKSIMTVNAEKKVFNIEKNIMTAGGSATDALKQVPVVEVDQDGNLSMRGSGNLKVFINGRPSGITSNNTKAILDAIPSSQIESIEVINNPSAKYDAEGEVGIINIVLKKNTKIGLNGNFTVGYGTKYDINTGVTLNFRKKSISFSTSYNFRFTESYYKGIGERYNFYPGQPPFYLNTNDYGTTLNFSNTINSSLDWYIKEKNTLSFSLLLSESNGNGKGKVNTDFLDSLFNYINSYDRYSNSKNVNWNGEVNASFRRTFKDNSNDLVIAGNYAYSDRTSKPVRYVQKTLDVNDKEVLMIPQRQTNSNYNTGHSGFVQADYTQPFKKIQSRLEFGYRFNMRDYTTELYADSLNTTTLVTVYDSSISNRYRYQEMIHAGYIIFGGSIKKIANYKAGIRLENTNIDLTQNVGSQSYRQKYFDYFPSASLSFNLKKNHSLSVSYSKRINRPNPEQLNPFGNYSDPYNILTGNPGMKPAYTHAAEITHVKNIDIKPGKRDSTFQRSVFFSTTVYYRYAYNVFTRFRTVDSLGRSVVNFDNLNTGQNIGVEFTNKTTLFRWWNFVLSANLFYNKIQGNVPNGEVDATTNSFQYNLRLMNTFNLTPRATLQLMVSYRSKIKFLQGEITPMVFANIGFRYDFLKENRASIAVNVSDIFHSQYFGVSTNGSTFDGTVRRYWESTVGNIVFTYRFGKSEQKQGMPKQKKSNFEDSGSGVEGGG
ncbi:MAG: TonB-dependent receptor [Sphingobacteriales bacterium]|nr:TonB-dependent receptor [Sphingobacteriales bacterium]